MAHFDVECLQEQYHEILKAVISRGMKRSPRGKLTRDLGFTSIVIHDVATPVLPLGTGRALSRSIAAVETLQVIAGVSRPDLLLRAAPRFESYMERDSLTDKPSYFHGAYGRRVGSQLHDALAKLRGDRDTRQAVITLWDPHLDNQVDRKDYPCTVALGLTLIADQLNLHVLMRSNDAWLGLPTDAFVFTQLQWTLAHALQVPPGQYTHTAWSLHLYDDDIERAEIVRGPVKRDETQPFGLVCDSFGTAVKTATKLLNGDGYDTWLNDEKRGHEVDWLRWYVSALAPVVG